MIDKKYSIVMPYYKRAGQLHNTLASFAHFYSKRDDTEIVIVEDVKNIQDGIEHEQLFKAVGAFDSMLDIRVLYSSSINIHNPSPLFNEGAALSMGEYLIITNPECIHMVDVLKGLDEEFKKNPDAYVVCGCESSAKNNEFIERFEDFEYEHHMWYQHSEHRNAMYHFCTALKRTNYMLVNGFDEDFALGIGYDDNMFRDRVISSGFVPVLRDDLLTVHCNHDRHHTKHKNYKALLNRNKNLYENKRRGLCLK